MCNDNSPNSTKKILTCIVAPVSSDSIHTVLHSNKNRDTDTFFSLLLKKNTIIIEFQFIFGRLYYISLRNMLSF